MKQDHGALQERRLSRAAKEIVGLSASGAERALEDYADQEGDEFAKGILARLPPVKIAGILRRHDFSCPSLIGWILTPKLVAEVFKIDPLFWEHVHDGKAYENYRRIQNDAFDLITSVLSNETDRNRQGEILRQVGDDDLSLQYLFLPFVGWSVRKNQTLPLEDPEMDFDSADHLYELIRWAAPHIAGRIVDFACSIGTPLPYYILDLWLEAFQYFEKGRDFKAIEDIMFRAPVAGEAQ